MANWRVERVAELLKQEISRILLHELQDPRMGFVTVTRVTLSGDLQHAKVYVSVLGGEVDERKTMAGLARARGYVQAAMSGRLRLRRLPALSFHLDPGVRRSLRVSRILAHVLPHPDGEVCQERVSEAEEES